MDRERAYMDSPKPADDRGATEKASDVAGKVANLLARANDLKVRLGRASDLRSNEDKYVTSCDPAAAHPRMLHESLDEASTLADRVNVVLDQIERRL